MKNCGIFTEEAFLQGTSLGMADNMESQPVLKEENSSITPVEPICEDVSNEQALPDDTITRIGLHKFCSFNDLLRAASKKPKPVRLYDELVIQGEITVMFAAPNVGKTAFGVQIAEEIAKSEVVTYMSYELSDMQLLDRYTNEDTGKVHEFPANLIFGWKSEDAYKERFTADKVVRDIEEYSAKGCEVFFIDNMSAICPNAADSELAGELMERFQMLKNKGLTIIVVAHPVKGRPKSYELCDIYGSSKIGALCDAAWVIGEDFKDNNRKYVKQVKARTGRKIYMENNVLCYNFNKPEFRFDFTGTGEEWEYLPSKDEFAERAEKAQKKEQAKTMKAAGKTIDQIAIDLGVPRATIGYWVKGM